MPRLVALDAGTEIDGHSHTRILLTSDGPYYTKFMREDGEARHAPANEQIAHTLLEALGVPVGRRASIELPPSIVTRTPELAKIMNPHGFGLAALSGAFDLRAGQIALLARRTPDRMILAAHVVLDITQQTEDRKSVV